MKIGDNVFAVVDKSDGHIADYFISEAAATETIKNRGFEVDDYTVVPVTIVETQDLARLKSCERVLREVEWSLRNLERFQCPECESYLAEGHADDCSLALALSPAGSGGEEKT